MHLQQARLCSLAITFGKFIHNRFLELVRATAALEKTAAASCVMGYAEVANVPPPFA